MAKSTKKEPLNEAGARAFIIKERMEREKKCSDEINVILKKYNCKMEAEAILRQGQVVMKGVIISN